MTFINVFKDTRGVSPVIGVILMVAITVILAAVIGAFVLGLGDDLGNSSGPQASLSFDGDTDGVTITHNGGDDLVNAELRGSAISVEETFDLSAGQEHPVEATLTEGTLNVVVDGSVVGSYEVAAGSGGGALESFTLTIESDGTIVSNEDITLAGENGGSFTQPSDENGEVAFSDVSHDTYTVTAETASGEGTISVEDGYSGGTVNLT
jgi:archaeal type IV pilus assembly protein PilA